MMSSDFYEIQTDADKIYRIFRNSSKRLYMTFSMNFEEFGSKEIGL